MERLYIKNMVCDRCKTAIQRALDQNRIGYKKIELGEIELTKKVAKKSIEDFRNAIQELGFELIEDRSARIISSIKSAIVDYVRYRPPGKKNVTLPQFLTDKLNREYSGLSSLFSTVEGLTIERFLILHKIERAKELIVYNELNLNEIAYQLGYSSAPHLSNQFKRITGLTPTHFKKIGVKKRTTLDKV